MGLSYPIFGIPNYPQATGTRPLAEQTKRKFLWDNCAKLYGLEG
jgi:predicted TIM-barrel fold metal-dependent hydrolase